MTDQRITISIDPSSILSSGKAAEYLGITTMTLSRWVREGKIVPIMLEHRYFHINELNRAKKLYRG